MIGILATILTIGSILPQIKKTWESKSVDDLSLWQMVILTIGILFWLLYGIQIHDTVVIVANSISLLLQLFMIGMKQIYGSKEYKCLKHLR
jgi:MtN3 and saliva related transmembrane protein